VPLILARHTFCGQINDQAGPTHNHGQMFLCFLLLSCSSVPPSNRTDSFQGDDKTKRCAKSGYSFRWRALIRRVQSSYIHRIEHGFADCPHSVLRPPRGLGRNRQSRDQVHYCEISSQAIPIALIISFKRNTSSVLPDHHISPLPHGSYKYSAISPLPPSTSST
jgi:hypothetical protein